MKVLCGSQKYYWIKEFSLFLGWIIGLGRNATTLDGQNDLVHLGDCDETVQKICADCGWLEELNNIPIQSLET